LFRPWLRFASRLMPGGKLPRADAELVILRVAVLAPSEYEWGHHERIARRVGLDRAAIERVRDGADAAGWSPRQVAILRAVDELHAMRTLSDQAWDALTAAGLTETELIELPMLVGHYEMLAMTPVAGLAWNASRLTPAMSTASTIGVFTAPGHTSVTPIRWRRRSKRSTSEMPRSPYFVAL
jgi:alkylhydroperoxidase family enzyme